MPRSTPAIDRKDQPTLTKGSYLESRSHCWRRDENGNLYRLLTPSEQEQLALHDEGRER